MPARRLRPSNLRFEPLVSYPYSPGAADGALVFTAGQVARTAQGELVGIGDPAAQTRQALSNVESVLREGGATLDDVLRCSVYLADIRHRQAVEGVFAELFPDDAPARTTVQALLAEPEMLVEIEAVAHTGRLGRPAG
jgi:enamine deaminase RidA (YjgF/YER057c/UK114 family)